MTAIHARFELITPAMAGGADPDSVAELRADAIAGQLRRWFWAREPLRGRRESAELAEFLFGTAALDAAQGAFLLSIADTNIRAEMRNAALGGTAISDLFGPLWKKRSCALWSSTEAPFFELELRLRPKAAKRSTLDPVNEMTAALMLWGLLGGIGAGQRRGFGSVQLTELRGETGTYTYPLDTPQRYESILAEALGAQADSFPCVERSEFAAFAHTKSLAAEIFGAGPEYPTAIAALKAVSQAASMAGFSGRNTVNFFSDAEGHQRKPSPFHFHVARIGSKFHVIVSALPAERPYARQLYERMAELTKGLKLRLLFPVLEQVE